MCWVKNVLCSVNLYYFFLAVRRFLRYFVHAAVLDIHRIVCSTLRNTGRKQDLDAIHRVRLDTNLEN